MVAVVAHVVGHFIHHLVDRVHLAAGEPLRLAPVAHGAALDQVAVVDQCRIFRVGDFGAGLFDQHGGAHQAMAVVHAVTVVVVVHHVGVDVGGFHQTQIHSGAGVLLCGVVVIIAAAATEQGAAGQRQGEQESQ